MVKYFITASLAAAVAVLSATAQPADQPRDPNSAALDGWLHAEQLNERCNLLHYYEVRLVEDSVFDMQNKAPEFRAIKFDNTMEAEERVARLQTLLADRRMQAADAMASAACDANHPAIRAIRGAYAPHFMQMLIGAHGAAELANARAGEKYAYDQLLALLQTLYGADWQTQVEATMSILNEQAGNWNETSMWSALRPHLHDVVWQFRLNEKGYKYKPIRGNWVRFQPVKADGTGAFPAMFQHRQIQRVQLPDGVTELYRVNGRMDDGRLVTMLASHSKSNPAGPLRATLLKQNEVDLLSWSNDDWRADTTAFEAETLDDDACPLDHCFVFPIEAATRMDTQTAEDSRVSYELYVGAPETYPLDPNAPSFHRQKVYATDFSRD
ncbi:MAG: hypothetical protein NXH78_07880 [Hyphomonadaceae bacterium]|nr:hypothetical protein [Hyphomonadaceae bacterium]